MNSKRPRKNTENQNSWCMVKVVWGFPGGSNSKESAFSAGDLGLTPGLRRPPGEGIGNPVQHSYLGNPIDRGAWWAAVHVVTKSQTRLNN